MTSMWEPFKHVNFQTLKQAVNDFSEDDGASLGASMAFSFFLALFPFLIFLAALAGFIGAWIGVENLFDQAMATMEEGLPGEAQAVVGGVLGEVLQTQSGGLLSFGAIGALWAAAGGIGALITALNRAYDVEEARPFWKARIVMVGLALGLSLLILLAFITYIFGGQIGSWVAGYFGMGPVFETVWNMLRWPFIAVMVLFALALVYYFGPAVQQQFRFISPGSVLATILWFIATAGFSIYVSNFADYSATYGSIGAIIILLMWLYITGMIIVLGGELNAVIQKATDPATQRDRESHLSPQERLKREKQQLEEDLARARRERVEVLSPAPEPTFSTRAFQMAFGAVLVSFLAAFASIIRRFLGSSGPSPTA
jgi:membrane protein